ncbi:complex I NDUFA9 subunit family protein [Paracoccus bogoriensis]|uniref:complex I NDUFA9 subunit family protein n=1 Tax=Paracoccus bogoriensis TaxID=242065 RepID=UPI001C67FF9D|nr:complex I NDUFA9 subunit family protein [Paracoccus bogoriensis]MBW7055234.1 complex I NDUFA9 subunit family protein [Paracoccus bogoriensis]
MAKLVTIFGGSGFVGRQVAQQMARDGWRVRVAVRRPDEALFTRAYGVVGQVVPILCNIRDEASVRAALSGADAAVNCVNILHPQGKSNFTTVFETGAQIVARLSAEMGVARLVHLSGLGIDPESKSRYVAAKSRGEAAVLAARPDVVVLRPSVIFGPDDRFYNRIAAMTRRGPFMPLLAGRVKMQPVYVEDVALAAAKAARGEAAPGIHELGGPDVLTMRQISEQVLRSVDRKKVLLPVPKGIARIGATMLDMLQFLSGGLFTNNILSRDQLLLLTRDNVVSGRYPGFAELGIQPVSAEAVIDSYLWPFRPGGQFHAANQSARNLRGQS